MEEMKSREPPAGLTVRLKRMSEQWGLGFSEKWGPPRACHAALLQRAGSLHSGRTGFQREHAGTDIIRKELAVEWGGRVREGGPVLLSDNPAENRRTNSIMSHSRSSKRQNQPTNQFTARKTE